jgi:hypothetical protein
LGYSTGAATATEWLSLLLLLSLPLAKLLDRALLRVHDLQCQEYFPPHCRLMIIVGMIIPRRRESPAGEATAAAAATMMVASQ